MKYNGLCRCVTSYSFTSWQTFAFIKNDIYFYRKVLATKVHVPYTVIYSTQGVYLQNVGESSFNEYFIDLQKERDNKLEKIINGI